MLRFQVRVMSPLPAAAATPVGAAGGVVSNTMLKGAPATQLAPVPVSVPLAVGAIESTMGLYPSLKPQRATRLVPLVSSLLMFASIWLRVRATLQTRVSSRTPWKRAVLPGVPSDLSITPRPAFWIVSERGAALVVSVPSSAPLRYRRTAVPSYVTAAWYQVPVVMAVVPDSG